MNNKNGKSKGSILKKIDNIILNFLDGYPPVVQNIARVIVFGGLAALAIVLVKAALSLLIPIIGIILVNVFELAILALFIGGFVYEVKLNMVRDENSFLLNERLKYQKKEYEERERRRREKENRR